MKRLEPAPEIGSIDFENIKTSHHSSVLVCVRHPIIDVGHRSNAGFSLNTKKYPIHYHVHFDYLSELYDFCPGILLLHIIIISFVTGYYWHRFSAFGLDCIETSQHRHSNTNVRCVPFVTQFLFSILLSLSNIHGVPYQMLIYLFFDMFFSCILLPLLLLFILVLSYKRTQMETIVGYREIPEWKSKTKNKFYAKKNYVAVKQSISISLDNTLWEMRLMCCSRGDFISHELLVTKSKDWH